MNAVSPHTSTRGAGLLLAHCAAFDETERAPAFSRLEALVGCDLAHLLVFALSGIQGLRGSSSP